MKRIVCLVTLVLVAAGMAGVVATPARAHDRAAVEKAVLDLINKSRASHGLRAVRIETHLDAAALAHSRQMLSRDYFSHNSAGGASFADASPRRRLQALGLQLLGGRRGDRLGQGLRRARAQAIFKAWMGSSGHRTVILDKRWRDVGIGCAQGSFRGLSGTLMYTVDFGRRAR